MPCGPRVDAIIAWLMKNQSWIERLEKLSLEFHFGGQSSIAEIRNTEKSGDLQVDICRKEVISAR